MTTTGTDPLISPRSEFYGTGLLIQFVINTDDRNGVIVQLTGLNIKTMITSSDEDFSHRLDVWVRSEEAASIVKITASDDIVYESWGLAEPDVNMNFGAVYTHRIGGPAVMDHTAPVLRRERFVLWDRQLPDEASYNAAITDGVADDPDRFFAWIKAKIAEANR